MATNVEKVKYIGQPVDVTYYFDKTNMRLNINGVDVDIYTSPHLEESYISINDYSKILGVKPDGGKFMYDISFPEIVSGYKSIADADETNRQIFFINVFGCKTMIDCPKYKKYKDIKKNIHDVFYGLVMPPTDTTESTTDFKMFDDTPVEFDNVAEQQETTVVTNELSIFDNMRQEVTSLETTVEELTQKVAQLTQENEALKKKTYFSVNEEKMNVLKTFITHCECTTDPYQDSYVLNTLTLILDKAIQEYIGNGGGKYDFIRDFNLATGRNTMYKNQPMEYINEPLVRIAMRLYEHEVLLFGLYSGTYAEYILHQFKNIFDINISNNKFILSLILGLLKRKIEVQIGSQNRLCVNLDFQMPQI